MSPVTIVLIVIVCVLAAVLIVLYLLGRRAKKRQEEQQEQIDRTAQPVSMLIIDKKRLPLKKSGLPAEVIARAPFLMKRSKVPIVKAKVGPRMVTLMCDPQIFNLVPVKKEVRAMVSGIYISDVRGLHSKIEAPTKKQGIFSRILFGKREEL